MISNIRLIINSSSSVTITWVLHKFADVTVYYSTLEEVTITPSTPHSKVSAFRLLSEVTLKDLVPGTSYNYVILVDNHFSKETISSIGVFETPPK